MLGYPGQPADARGPYGSHSDAELHRRRTDLREDALRQEAIYIYIYIYICKHIHTYVYIYIYIA